MEARNIRVVSDSEASGVAEEPEWPNHTARSLATILRGADMLVPDDIGLIQRLTNDDSCTAEDIEELIGSGWLRRLVVGSEPHLALVPREEPRTAHSRNFPMTPQADQGFRQRVLVDVEAERIVLYRVAVIIQSLMTLLLVRSWVLYWLLP